MKATTTFIMSVLALSASSTKIPSIMWGSTGVVIKSETDSSLYSTPSALTARFPGLSQIYFVETGDNDFSARSLSTNRNEAFAAALPSPKIEALYTAGAGSDIVCLSNKETLLADVDAALAAGTPAYVCVDHRTDAPAVIGDVTKHMEGRSYVAVYTAETPVEAAPEVSKEEEDEEETTIWSGGILTGLFAFVVMLIISWYMMRLMLSLQSQPFTDIPKQKQI